MSYITTLREGKVKARKTHRCYHCYGPIEKGEVHRSATYKYDDIYTIRSHFECDHLWDAYMEYSSITYFDLWDGIPPIADYWGDEGVNELRYLCNKFRGRYPRAVTLIELSFQRGDFKYIEWRRSKGFDDGDRLTPYA